MGFIIGLANEVNHGAFVSIENAFIFLKEVENKGESRYSTYRDIAEFLMRNKFHEMIKGATYERFLDGTYSLISDESYNSFNVLSDIILTNKLKRIDDVIGVDIESPFNLYWKKADFIQSVEQIAANLFSYQDIEKLPECFRLPDIDLTLRQLTRRRIDLKLFVPDYRELPDLENRLLLMAKENQELKEKIKQNNKIPSNEIAELQAEITRLKSELAQYDFIQKHRQFAPAFNALLETLACHAHEYDYTQNKQPLNKNIMITFKEKNSVATTDRRADEVARILKLPEKNI